MHKLVGLNEPNSLTNETNLLIFEKERNPLTEEMEKWHDKLIKSNIPTEVDSEEPDPNVSMIQAYITNCLLKGEYLSYNTIMEMLHRAIVDKFYGHYKDDIKRLEIEVREYTMNVSRRAFHGYGIVIVPAVNVVERNGEIAIEISDIRIYREEDL